MRIASGVTDQYVYFVAVDSTDLKTRETGLTTFTVYRSRNGGAAAAMTTPTINETDSTNMPGVYELLLDEDMTIDSGDDTQEMVFHITQADMAPVTRTIELYRPKITAGNTLGVASDGDISGNVDGNVVGSVASVTATVTANATQISGSSAAADNVESVFTGTGITDDVDLKARSIEITSDVGDAVTFKSTAIYSAGLTCRAEGDDGKGIQAVATGGLDLSGSTGIIATCSGTGSGFKIDGQAYALECTQTSLFSGPNVAAGPGIIVQAGSDAAPGMRISGAVTGAGLEINGGATGPGMDINGGSTSGEGVHVSTTSGDAVELTATGGNGLRILSSDNPALLITSLGTNDDGVTINGGGTGSGLTISGGATGRGVWINGGVTSGNGVQINTFGSSDSVVEWNGDALDNLAKSVQGILFATFSGTPTTTSGNTDLSGYLDEELIGRTMYVITGTGAGQVGKVTDYAQTSGVLTYEDSEGAAFTTAPASGDTLVLV